MAGGGGAGAQGGGAAGGDDNAFNIIWMIFFVFLVGVLIWLNWGNYLKDFFLWIKKIQLIVINFSIKMLPFKFLSSDEISKGLELVMNVTGENLSLEVAEYISLLTGKYLTIPVILTLLFFCYIGFFKNPINQYKKTYNMHSLALQESMQWPQIRPTIGLNLVKEPLNVGIWAMGKSPVDFCKEHHLITIVVEQNQKNNTTNNSQSFNMILDEEKAELVFATQLGKLWKSPESLAIHKQALFAIFLARACREPDIAAKLLKQINISCDSKKPNVLDFTGVDKIWKKYYNNQIIQDSINKHAYEYTIFIELLILARKDGVLPTADFLWLKPIDRLFWYVLNSTGRQTYFAEAAGVHAHFLVEKFLGRSLSIPYVKEAVKALNLALKDIIYVPTPEERQSLLNQK